jgi:threonine/homoserine/homoserine lactone efflux protein
MEQYFVYVAIASLAIVSPEPGVVQTITNSLK